VRCTVVSFSRNAHVDAYVLSESSLFVAKRRLVLKTCGNTTPLKCINNLIDLARIYAGFDVVEVRTIKGFGFVTVIGSVI
jgi:S-adenosylmethionine decarboxylase